jgi:pimeloyl-ACP methyl ester carboxylesterase
MKITLEQFILQNPNFSYWKFFTSAECPLLLRRRLPVFWNAVIRTGDEPVVPMAEIEGRLRAEHPPVEWQQRPGLWDQETYDAYMIAYWRGGWEAPMNRYKAFLENFEDELQFVGTKLDAPFLIVLGEKDPAVPLQATYGTENFLANHEIVSLPCGHWVPQESGPAVVKTVIDWLGKIIWRG